MIEIARASYLSFGPRTVDVRGHQIIVWLSLRQLVFPAILDIGHSHNFTISSRHLAEWAAPSGDAGPLLCYRD
jgi:hypothetical protein